MSGSMLKSLYTVKRCLSCLSTPGLSTHMAVKLVFSSLCARGPQHTPSGKAPCVWGPAQALHAVILDVSATRHGGRCGYEHGRGG